MNNQYNYNNSNNGYQGYGYQGYGYNPNTYYQPPQKKILKGQAVASMVLGIIALVYSSTVIIGIVCAIISLCLAGASKRNNGGEVLGMATAGKVCSIIAIILSIFMLIFWISYIALLIDILLYGFGDYYEGFYYSAMTFFR